MKYLIAFYRLCVAYLGLIIVGSITSLLYLLSFGYLRRFNAEVLTPILFRTILFFIGIRLERSFNYCYEEPGMPQEV